MEWSELTTAALAIWSAYQAWRRRKERRQADETRKDLEAIREEAERLRRADTLAEQARAARERAKGS
jgi:hypothetical protein